MKNWTPLSVQQPPSSANMVMSGMDMKKMAKMKMPMDMMKHGQMKMPMGGAHAHHQMVKVPIQASKWSTFNVRKEDHWLLGKYRTVRDKSGAAFLEFVTKIHASTELMLQDGYRY